MDSVLLIRIKDRRHDALDRLRAVRTHYALITHRRGLHADGVMTFLHRDGHAIKAEHAIARLIRDLLAEAAETGDVRTEVASGELSRYCLHALTAAGSMPSKAAVDRLIAVTMDGLGAPPGKHITRLRPGPRPAPSPVGYSPSCFTYAADFG